LLVTDHEAVFGRVVSYWWVAGRVGKLVEELRLERNDRRAIVGFGWLRRAYCQEVRPDERADLVVAA
jgi:hypothetical protein